MKRFLVALALISTSAAFAKTPNIEGSYKCGGYDPFFKKDYTGVVTVKKTGDTFALTMRYDTGNSTGTGIMLPLTKQGLSNMAIVYKDDKDPNMVGVQHYTISKDGKKMAGLWTNGGETKVSTETCVKED